MTDDELIRRIRKLQTIQAKLRRVEGQVQSLDFSQFKSSGSHQWSGQIKKDRYDEAFRQGQSKLRQVTPEIQDAIQSCQSKMMRLAWSVKDLQKKAMAFRIIMF